jgi:hypothetical protein
MGLCDQDRHHIDTHKLDRLLRHRLRFRLGLLRRWSTVRLKKGTLRHCEIVAG